MVELYENKEIRTMGAVKGTKAPSNCLLGYKTEEGSVKVRLHPGKTVIVRYLLSWAL